MLGAVGPLVNADAGAGQRGAVAQHVERNARDFTTNAITGNGGDSPPGLGSLAGAHADGLSGAGP